MDLHNWIYLPISVSFIKKIEKVKFGGTLGSTIIVDWYNSCNILVRLLYLREDKSIESPLRSYQSKKAFIFLGGIKKDLSLLKENKVYAHLNTVVYVLTSNSLYGLSIDFKLRKKNEANNSIKRFLAFSKLYFQI